jgi:PHD/YefM family antitoxin component YafN of YafNO toxin-antitoxin module
MPGPVTQEEPKIITSFPSCTSKEARDNLPAILDEVVDSGVPVVIKKLSKGRAAVIPARDLWLYAVMEELNMDRGSINKPIKELMKEIHRKCEQWLKAGVAK